MRVVPARRKLQMEVVKIAKKRYDAYVREPFHTDGVGCTCCRTHYEKTLGTSTAPVLPQDSELLRSLQNPGG